MRTISTVLCVPPPSSPFPSPPFAPSLASPLRFLHRADLSSWWVLEHLEWERQGCGQRESHCLEASTTPQGRERRTMFSCGWGDGSPGTGRRWRRFGAGARGWSSLPSEGPCSPGRDTGHLMRTRAPPRAGQPGGVAPCSPASPTAASLTSRGGRAQSGSRDAARGKSPRLAAGSSQPGAPGGGVPGAGPGLGARVRQSSGVRCQAASFGRAQTPPAGLLEPRPDPRPRGKLGAPDLRSPRPRPHPHCGWDRTSALACAATRSPSLSKHNWDSSPWRAEAARTPAPRQ